MDNIIGNYDIFLWDVFHNIKNVGFELSEFSELDHMCYRVETSERYIAKKIELGKIGELLSEEIIADRPIAIYKLKIPILVHGFKIYYMELPAPKINNRFKEGLEHVEFVINVSLHDFLVKHHNINFCLDSYDREINPELEIEFEHCAVKFHKKNILEVIAIQKLTKKQSNS